MTAEVLEFDGITRHDLPADRVLDSAKEADLESCVVIGFTNDEDMYIAVSNADGADMLWRLERAKHHLMLKVDELSGL